MTLGNIDVYGVKRQCSYDARDPSTPLTLGLDKPVLHPYPC